MLNQVFKYRHCFLFFLFAFLVMLKINFSSISVWNNFVPNSNPALTIGHARMLRSDEWATNLTWQMSQVYNNYATYNYRARLHGLNTVIAQYQAAWNIENLGRPINWGFLLFDNSHGLSWYWSLKIILLFISSLEVIYILVPDKTLAVCGAFIITYAPGIQWWLSNYIAELITSTQMIIWLSIYMLQRQSWRYKILPAFFILLFMIGFIFTLYPPLQVPLLYFLLIFLIAALIKNKPGYKDLILIGLILSGVLVILLRFYLYSKQDMYLVTHTVYPGNRKTSSGMVSFLAMFDYLNNIIIPNRENTSYDSPCGLSNFWTLFPIFPFICYFIPFKKRGVYFNVTLFVNTFFLVFMLVPLLLMDKINHYNLWDRVTGNKVIFIFGLLNTYLILFFIKNRSKCNYRLLLLYANFIVWITICIGLHHKPVYVNMKHSMFITIFILWMIVHLILINKPKIALGLMVILTVLSGVVVNTITVGTNDLYGSNTSKVLQAIRAEDPNAVWVATDSWIYGEYLLAQGLYAFNSVKFYPDFEVLYRLDPKKYYEDVYNRYAHITVKIVPTETKFVLIQGDLFELAINVEDLIKKTNINYILSHDSPINNKNFILIGTQDGFRIYHVLRKAG
jgi:hypothetical protein